MPATWADEFVKREHPIGPLVLCYDAKRLALPDGRSLADVSADLSRGAWLTRVGPESPVFRLGGAEFQLRLFRRPEEQTGVMLAVVQSVDEAVSVGRRADLFVTEVTFTKLWQPQGCDLAEVHAALRSRRVARQKMTGRRDGSGAQGNFSHGGIRAEIDRQYGDLDALFKLLQQRREKSEERLEGVLQPGGGHGHRGMISVRLEEGVPDVRPRRICMTSDGRPFNTRVFRARGDELQIERPDRWQASSDGKVTIDLLPPFDMWQNEEALHSFVRGDVEGSWEDLARLLCSPGELQGPDPSLQLPYFYSDDDPEAPSLNSEQRRAVTGAASSPHAFVIQGPPGTGKTSVICEVIRQLVARGERVLLLAPAHVAVDEVLSRIGRKPGVRALRITRDEDRVDEKLRMFIPHYVGSESADLLLRRADDGRVSRWARERVHVESELSSLERLRTALQQCDGATGSWRAASAAALEAGEQLRARESEARWELAEVERALARDDAALAAVSTAAREERLREEAERARLGSLATSLLDAATDLDTTARSLRETVEGERRSEAELQAWSTASPQQSRAAAAHVAVCERSVAEARHGAVAAEQELAAAEQALASAMRRRFGIGRLVEGLGIGELAKGRRAVEFATAVVQGWRVELGSRTARERAARAAYNQLVAEEKRAGAGLRSALEARQAARRHLEQALPSAIARVSELLTSMGMSVGLPNTAGEEVADRWGRFGRRLHEYLTSVLTGGAMASPVRTEPAMEPLISTLEPLRAAVLRRQTCEQELASAAQRRDDRASQRRQVEVQQSQELERLTNLDRAAQEALVRRQAEMEALVALRDRIRAELGYPEGTNLDERRERLRRRHLVLGHLPELDRRWGELSAEATDEQILDEIHRSVLRATNLVCATTKGIVSRGSGAVRDTDFDTLIVDEASRVTESEFLIGGVRARRWIVVGDEHQLPPHVEARHEHFLHALAALHRTGRGASPSLKEAVKDLAELWADEGEDVHAFRTEEVERIAEGFEESGEWDRDYRDQFVEALGRLNRKAGDDPDRALLAVMQRFFTQSMFQRTVEACKADLREQLLEQRRMIAPLARIVSEPVYGGHYVTPSESELARCGVTPLVTETFSRPAVFLDTSSFEDAGDRQSGYGFVNEREQKLIVQACQIYDKQLQDPISVSVVTFYRAQARALDVLRTKNLAKLDFKVIDVIDAIQGQESDLVIISFTRARTGYVGERYGQWLQDVRRLNVACTRARRGLLLVGHGKTLSRLRSSPRGQAFYAHLLHLFSAQNDDFLTMRRP